MDKTQLVKAWVFSSGAVNQLGSKGKAFALGWKLLNDYLYFSETGCCPVTRARLYDFSQFITNFADHYAGPDDDLYTWIVNNGHTIIEALHKAETEETHEKIPNALCPLCSVPLSADNVARLADGSIRKSAAGRAWCKECAVKIDKNKWTARESPGAE